MNRNTLLGTCSTILFVILLILVAKNRVSILDRDRPNPLERKLMAAAITSNNV